MILVRIVKRVPVNICEDFNIRFVRAILPCVEVLKDITGINGVDGDLELVVSKVNGRYRSVAAITYYNAYTKRRFVTVIGPSFDGIPFYGHGWREQIGGLIVKIQTSGGTVR